MRYIAAIDNKPAHFEYDYFVKDHLGNVRAVLTEEKEAHNYIATMETGARAQENQLFDNLNVSQYPASTAGFPGGGAEDPNATVAHVNGNTQKKGPAIVLKVMAGDVVDIGVRSLYLDNPGTKPTADLFTEIISSLAGGIVSTSGVAKGTLTELIDPVNSPLVGALTGFRQDNNNDITGKPKAYLNWMLLDEQFKYVNSFPQSGALPVGAAEAVTSLVHNGIDITKNGYLYIYVSNETENWDVFFDDLAVTHHTGPLMEETHYYPFGLTMAGISTKAVTNAPENRYKYNGIEQTTELGLNQYDAYYRTLDPQIGRFLKVDPKIESGESWSPYTSMLNNPILNKDPLGDSSVPWPARVSQTPYNPVSPLIYQGKAGMKAESVRNQYNKETALLSKDDKAGRAALKEKARTNTPEPFYSVIEKGRPMEGERAKVNDPNFKGNATKTNIEINETITTTGFIGKSFIIGAAAQSAYTIATSKTPVQETVSEATGWVGAAYGGAHGAEMGAVAGPWGAFIGGALGSAVGFFVGKNVSEAIQK